MKVKDEMETDLYKRFLLLLNTKKKKIAELESLLDNAGKKVKGNQKESKLNPYDVETDADSDSDSEIKISSKKSIVSDKSKKKSVTKSDSPTEKSPVGKKMKQSEKIAENINNQNSATNTLNSEPQNSREESISPQKSNIPSTKQELLTYFYGP